MNPLLDAHNHLQDPLLQSGFPEIWQDMRDAGVGQSLVNGTCQDDWATVAELAQRYPGRIVPSFGLHPWRVAERKPGWREELIRWVENTPGAGVGECGLDRWIENHDLADQKKVFLPQVALAAKLNRPLTIHCLRAWGPLLDCLRASPLPERGFLLHAYGGSPELIPELTQLGAYFSFSGSFLAPTRERKRETFRKVPRDRLLIETDAPAMPLPADLARYTLPSQGETRVNHPANLAVTFSALAEFLDLTVEDLRATLQENETRFLQR